MESNFSKAVEIIKTVYDGEYSGRGSWDMVIFRGEDHAERCQKCWEEVKGLFDAVRDPQIGIDGTPGAGSSYFQCR